MSQAQSGEQPSMTDQRVEDVVAGALRDEELMRQVRESLEAERRGEPPVPLSQILEEAKQRNLA